MRFLIAGSVLGTSIASLSAPAGALASGAGQESLGSRDAFEMAILTILAVGGAAILLSILYLVRLKVGFWLHRPPARREGDAQAQH